MIQDSFEVQRYAQGRWQVLAIFDDRELALSHAATLRDLGRHPGLRVRHEAYDERRNHFTSTTIFRHSRLDNHNISAVRTRGAEHRRLDPVSVLSQPGRLAALEADLPPEGAEQFLASATLKLAKIMMLGLFALIMLRCLKLLL